MRMRRSSLPPRPPLNSPPLTRLADRLHTRDSTNPKPPAQNHLTLALPMRSSLFPAAGRRGSRVPRGAARQRGAGVGGGASAVGRGLAGGAADGALQPGVTGPVPAARFPHKCGLRPMVRDGSGYLSLTVLSLSFPTSLAFSPWLPSSLSQPSFSLAPVLPLTTLFFLHTFTHTGRERKRVCVSVCVCV